MEGKKENIISSENLQKKECEAEKESMTNSSSDDGDNKVVEMQPVASTSGDEEEKFEEWKVFMRQATDDHFSASHHDSTAAVATASTYGLNFSEEQPDRPSPTSTDTFNLLLGNDYLMSRFVLLHAQRLQTISRHMQVITEMGKMLQQLSQMGKDSVSSPTPGTSKQAANKQEEEQLEAFNAKFAELASIVDGMAAEGVPRFPQSDHSFSAAAAAANLKNEEEWPQLDDICPGDESDENNEEKKEAHGDVNGKKGGSHWPFVEPKGKE